MKKVVSIRINRKLLNTLLSLQNYKNTLNQSEKMLVLLKSGYWYLKYDCKQLIENKKKAKKQLKRAFWTGTLTGVFFGLFVTGTYLFLQKVLA